jgi:hypothetical protein
VCQTTIINSAKVLNARAFKHKQAAARSWHFLWLACKCLLSIPLSQSHLTNDVYISLSGGIMIPCYYYHVSDHSYNELDMGRRNLTIQWEVTQFLWPLWLLGKSKMVLLSYYLITWQSFSSSCPFAWVLHSSTYIFTYTTKEQKFLWYLSQYHPLNRCWLFTTCPHTKHSFVFVIALRKHFKFIFSTLTTDAKQWE